MIIANIYALKAPSLRWNGMVVFSSMTVLFLSLLWIQVAYAISRDSLGFLRDKCEAKAGEAFKMES